MVSRGKIDSRTIRQRVYDELKTEITEGRILPGQKVSLRLLLEVQAAMRACCRRPDSAVERLEGVLNAIRSRNARALPPRIGDIE